MLPEGWNSSQDVYALQYRYEKTKQLGLVKVIPLGSQLLISAVVSLTLHGQTVTLIFTVLNLHLCWQAACKSSEVFTTTIGIDDYVQEKEGTVFTSKRFVQDQPVIQSIKIMYPHLQSFTVYSLICFN